VVDRCRHSGDIRRRADQLFDDRAPDIDGDAADVGKRLLLAFDDALFRRRDLRGQFGRQSALALRGLGGHAVGRGLDCRHRLRPCIR